MRKFLSKFDLFPAAPILRADGQTEVVNLCGSIFSMIVFGTFAYIFIVSIVNTVKLQNISATETIETKSGSDVRVGNITMGVGLQQMDIVALRSIFEFRAFVMDQNMQTREIQVMPCTRQMWEKLDDTKYRTLNAERHMCIQREGVQIFGESGSIEANLLYFNLSKCSNSTSPVPCAPPAVISSFFATQLLWGRFLACSLLILDTGLNPTKQNPYTYLAYEKTLWLLFNEQQQILGQIYLGTYQITTDTNFLPFVTQNKQSGYFVSQTIISTLINTFSLSVLVQFYIFASPINKVINRNFGKFDGNLSYVGGLYGIVISFFAFFLMSFNEYKYELRVSEGAFSFEHGHLAREQDLHFGKYLKYVAYDWCKTLFCCSPNWQDCKAIDQARQQAIEQIDIKHLLKRITHLQKIIQTLTSPQQQLSLLMTQSTPITQLRKRRNISQYCQQFTTVDKSLTITNFDQLNAVLSFTMNMNMNIGGGGEALGNKIVPGESINNSILEFKKIDAMGQMDDAGKSSFGLMDEYLDKYVERFNIKDDSFQLSQENLQAEEQLAEAFYALEEKTRKRIIKKIPLGILFRLSLKKNKKEGQQKYETFVTEESFEKNFKSSTNNKQSIATLQQSMKIRR